MRKKRSAVKPLAAATAVTLIVLVYLLSYSPAAAPISNEGFTLVNVSIAGTALTFSAECRAVTMNIHEVQALSIANGMNNVIDVRPLTHDMMRDVLDNFGIKLLLVRIESFESEIWRATTFVQQGNKILDVDTRPSDAIGIAVRTGAPVYFNTELLEARGEKAC